eukprot:717494-Rhodomonas_salina.4
MVQANTRCVDTEGSFTCECSEGYTTQQMSSNPVCRACAACASGSFISDDCNATADTRCAPCSTRCPTEEYPNGGCSGILDTVCTRCLDCLDRGACPSCQAANVTFTATLLLSAAAFDAAKQLAFRTAVARATGVPASLVRIAKVTATDTARRAAGVEVVTAVETAGARVSV